MEAADVKILADKPPRQLLQAGQVPLPHDGCSRWLEQAINNERTAAWLATFQSLT